MSLAAFLLANALALKTVQERLATFRKTALSTNPSMSQSSPEKLCFDLYG
jgi:hypothetical protein